MAALPTSLRRTLFVLLGFSTFVLVMVFYWNQSATRAPSALMGSYLVPLDRHKYAELIQIQQSGSTQLQSMGKRQFDSTFSPPEPTWTYKCVSDRCVREHSTPGEKRVPFMSCAMICGSLNIWPLPTMKADYSIKSLTFGVDDIQVDVKTKFGEAKKLMLDAFDIFLFDVRHLAGRAQKSSAESASDTQRAAQTERSSGKGNDIGADNRNCDINKIVITAEIFSSADHFVHLDIDESYELNVTRKWYHF